MPLRRALGLGGLTFYGIGLILGAGIYSILGEAAGVAGTALWLAFLLGSLAALLTGLAYAELATMYPEAGAEYVYLGKAWPRARWLPGAVGWALVAAGVATAATVALAFAGYARAFLDVPAWLIAVGLLLLAALVNVVGVREASWMNILFTLIEGGGLIALIVVGARDPDFADAFLTAPHGGVLAAAGLIFFAYLGFEEIANMAEEAKRPERDLPRAILFAVAVSTLLYVLVAVATVALLDPDALARSDSPLADAMRAASPRLAGALGGVALFATANTALISLLAASRLVFSMARGGDAPRIFERTLPRRDTPAWAIALVAVAAALFLPLGEVGVIGSVASLMALLAFASVNAALIRLRFRAPDAERPFRVPMRVKKWPVLSVAGLAIVALLVAQFSWQVYLIGAGALLFGIVMERIPWRSKAR